ncbi:hypothetical protein Tco_0714157 [Tanacetum coccineum]
MIRSLMYLIASRPDIQFSTCLCVRYQANPKESYLIAAKRIFRARIRYSGANLSLLLLYFLKEPAYAKSGAYPDTTSNRVAKGSLNADEYVGVKEVVGGGEVLGIGEDDDLCNATMDGGDDTIKRGDISILNSLIGHGRPRSLQLCGTIGTTEVLINKEVDKEVQYNVYTLHVLISFLKHLKVVPIPIQPRTEPDHILKRDIELHFIPTQYQLADIFTKPLDELTFKILIVELGMQNIDGSNPKPSNDSLDED